MESDLFNEKKLQHVLELMKNRREIDHPVNYDAIRETSVLLVDGILMKLINYLTAAIETVNQSKILEVTENSVNAPSNLGTGPSSNTVLNTEKLDGLNWNLLKVSSEIIFFALYQTQIEVEEAKALLELIHLLSDVLSKTIDEFSTNSISSIAIASASTNINTISSTSSPLHLKNHITTSLLYILIVLQLSHVCAHQQIAKLLSRRKNYYNLKSFEIEPGNILPQKRGSKYGLEKSNWKCSGVKGFMNLVFAVFRQPEVDEGKTPKEDVEWFMHEACVLRGYSYIRLILLPMIRNISIIHYEYSLFFSAVLSELLENLSKIFVFSHYDHNENDFPYIFFPPTMDFYVQNIHFYQGVLEEYEHSRMSPFKRSSNMSSHHQQNSSMMNVSMLNGSNISGYDGISSNMIMDVDTLQDVINLYIEVLQYYPSFATVFWGEIDNEITEEERVKGFSTLTAAGVDVKGDDEDDEIEELQLLNTHLPEFHHFITKVIESTQHHRHLILDTLRLLSALGNGPKGCTARLVYYLISQGFLNRMDWDRIIDKITRFILEFASPDQEDGFTGPVAAGRQANTVGGASGGSNSLISLRAISPVDLEGILIFVELIGTVCVRRNIIHHFQKHYQILSKLFALLSCPIPIEIKGKIFITISQIAKFPKYHSIIWEQLETSGLFSSLFLSFTTQETGKPSSIPTAPGNKTQQTLTIATNIHQSSSGLKAELEENESRTGRYPMTLGFLQLFRNLLQFTTTEYMATLHHLGQQYRVPGILPYLDYIIEDIFMKVHERYYSPDEVLNVISQRWRITSYCLEIFSLIMQLYPIHQYDKQQFIQTLLGQGSLSTPVDPYLLDFKEEYVNIPGTGISGSQPINTGGTVNRDTSSQNRYKRPKTPGFYLLALLLNNSKFTELFIKIITTIDRNYLLQGLKSSTMNEFLTIFEVFKYGFVHSKLRSRLSYLFVSKDRFLPYASSQYYSVSSGTGSGGESDFHLSDAKFDPLSANTVFWLERALANALFFLYEILLREASFYYYLKNCHQPIYLTKYDSPRRFFNPTTLHPYSFLDILTGYQVTNKLILLTSLEFLTLPSVPLPNILIIKIFEQILLQKPYYSIFSTTSTDNVFISGVMGAGRRPSTNSSSANQFTALDVKQIIECFANHILYEKDFPTYLYDEYSIFESHYNLFYVGGDSSPVIISDFFYDGHSRVNHYSYWKGGMIASTNSTGSIYGSLRHAIISLILNTLVTSGGGSQTFNHHLLGLSDSHYHPFLSYSSSSYSLLTTSESIEGRKDCFNALIQVVSPYLSQTTQKQQQLNHHFFLRYPDQALMIYEIIYHLSKTSTSSSLSSSNVGRQTLQRLRDRRNHQFLLEQFQYFFNLISLSKDELLQLLLEIDAFDFHPPQKGEDRGDEVGNEAHREEWIQQKMLMKLYDLHTKINHSLAYLIKIFNQELALTFFSSSASSFDSNNYPTIKSILDLLLHRFSVISMGNGKGLDGTETREEKVNLLQPLYYAFHDEEVLALPNSLLLSFNEFLHPAAASHRHLPIILQALKQSMVWESSSSRRFTVANASTTSSTESETIAAPSFRRVNISEFTGKLKEYFSLQETSNNVANTSSTSLALIPAGVRGNEDKIHEIERILENSIKLAIVFNQQEQLQASQHHLILALRQLVDSILLPALSSSSLTSLTTGAPTILKALLELQTIASNQSGNSLGSNVQELKYYLFIEVLIPYSKFLLRYFTDLDMNQQYQSSVRLSLLKALITILSFISSASESQTDKADGKKELLIFAWKDLIETIYQLLLKSSSTNGSNSQTLIASQQHSAFKILIMSLSDSGSASSSSPTTASNMVIRGYLVSALQLTLKLASPTSSFFGEPKSVGVGLLNGTRSTVFLSSQTITVGKDIDQSSEEKKSYSPTGRIQKQDESNLDLHLQMFLQRNALPLLELIFPVAIDGLTSIRMNAINTLSMIFRVLTNESDNSSDEGLLFSGNGRHLFMKLVHLLAQKGFLNALLQRSSFKISEEVGTSIIRRKKEELSLYLTVLQFLNQLVSLGSSVSSDTAGVGGKSSSISSFLLESGVIEQLCYSDSFSDVISQLLLLLPSNSTINSTSNQNTSSLLEQYVFIFLETLSLLTTLLSSTSTSASSDKPLLQCLIFFYQRHREGFSQLVHQSIQNLLQLECFESFFSFLNLFLQQCIRFYDHQNSQTKVEERYYSSYQKLFLLFSKDIEILLADCLHLFSVFGEKTVPGVLLEFYHHSKVSSNHQQTANQLKSLAQLRQRQQQQFSNNISPSAWWESIQPGNTSSVERNSKEKFWQTTLLSQSLAASDNIRSNTSNFNSASTEQSVTLNYLVPNQWTVFHELKLEKTLNILTSIVNILRILSVPDQRLFITSQDKTITASASTAFVMNEKRLFHLPQLLRMFNDAVMVMTQLQLFHDGLWSVNSTRQVPASTNGLKTREERLLWLSSYKRSAELSSAIAQNERNVNLAVSIFIQFKSIIIAENAIIAIYHILTSSLRGHAKEKVLSEEEKQTLTLLFQTSELLPTRSFCRIVMQWIYEEINQAF